MPGDWHLTLRQALPRLLALWRHARPTHRASSIAALSPAYLRSLGVAGVIWDVDGTLTAHHGVVLHPTVAAAWVALLDAPELRHVVLSNCDEARFRELGGMFRGVPILRGYATAAGTVFRRLVGMDDSWSPAEHERRLGAGARPLRKPNPELVSYAVRELGCDAEHAVMVGDQYFTDVAGAGAAGVRSIKVQTLAVESFPATIRVLQRLEAAAAWLAPRARHRGSR
jgi:predicted HAD superfamily phosphohydrolase YqeG